MLQPVRVVAGRDEKCGGDVGADAAKRDELGCDGLGDAVQPAHDVVELGVEVLDPLSEFAHRQAQHARQAVVVVADPEARAGPASWRALRCRRRSRSSAGAVATSARSWFSA